MPFGNKVVLLQCKGSDILAATGQNAFGSKTLQVSQTFAYSWSSSTSAADPASFMIKGVLLDPATTYGVVISDFLQGGGDGYTAFGNCTNPVTLGVDITAFVAYLGNHPNLAPPLANRITRTN
jgi:5'-nucleotidase